MWYPAKEEKDLKKQTAIMASWQRLTPNLLIVQNKVPETKSLRQQNQHQTSEGDNALNMRNGSHGGISQSQPHQPHQDMECSSWQHRTWNPDTAPRLLAIWPAMVPTLPACTAVLSTFNLATQISWRWHLRWPFNSYGLLPLQLATLYKQSCQHQSRNCQVS